MLAAFHRLFKVGWLAAYDATLVERVFALFFIDHLVNRFG